MSYELRKLISFGNYLLSQERAERVQQEKNSVWDADIEHWKNNIETKAEDNN